MKYIISLVLFLAALTAKTQILQPYTGKIKIIKSKHHVSVDYEGIRGIAGPPDTTLLITLLKKGTINTLWFFDEKILDNCCGTNNDVITDGRYGSLKKELKGYKGKYIVFDELKGSGTTYELSITYQPVRYVMIYVFEITFDKDPKTNADAKAISLKFSYMPY